MWIKIKGKDNYSVNEMGKVRNDKSGRILKTFVKPDGYEVVQMGKRCSPQYIHRVILEAFIPNAENKPCVNHIDGNRSNNTLANLEWCTYSENMVAYGHKQRKNNRKRPIKAIHMDGREIIFNSRLECAEYFETPTCKLKFNHVYLKSSVGKDKRGWKFIKMS